MPKGKGFNLFRRLGLRRENKEAVPERAPEEEAADRAIMESLEAELTQKLGPAHGDEPVPDPASQDAGTPQIFWSTMYRAYQKHLREEASRAIPTIEGFIGKRGHELIGNEVNREIVFTKERVERDLEYVKKREAGFEDDLLQSSKRLAAKGKTAKIQESRFFTRLWKADREKEMADAIERFMKYFTKSIYGKNVEGFTPYTVTDIGKGIDEGVIFPKADGSIDQVFGLDFTSATESDAIDWKLERSLMDIEEGNLGEIDYLVLGEGTPNPQFFRAKGVVRIPVGISRYSALMMANKWLDAGPGSDAGELEYERRAGFLKGSLDVITGLHFIAKERDKEKGWQESFASKELGRAKARLEKILSDSGLDKLKPKMDRTFERIAKRALDQEAMLKLWTDAKQTLRERASRRAAGRGK